MEGKRPDPDALLRVLQRDASSRTRGRLKVFLGSSAGVGKTYAMLSEAHEQRARGIDVVVGFVETHRRTETQALVEGLEVLPRRRNEYRGTAIEEFDLDGALARRPQLILVDELAHTNAPGSRHRKRWQDVGELLDAGIDVYTAVNVQHLESLNDAVAQITGVVVRETLPDAVLERADDIEVIDIPPEELRQRLREGKVYVPERIEHALEGFFRPANLVALRELALRRAADRVDAEMQRMRAEQGASGLWPARDRVLVCVAPNELASRVVRAAARIGAASHAEMLALYVESDRQAGRDTDQHAKAFDALRLAERLGMKTETRNGHDIVGEILDVARNRNVNLVVVGKPIKARWREIAFGSVVDELVRRSGEIDVHVITAEGDTKATARRMGPSRETASLRASIGATVILAAALGVAFGLDRLGGSAANIIMVLLAAVVVVANRFGRREAVLASLLSVLGFNFFFVEPRMTFAVSDTQYVLTFLIMLGVALLISSLTLRLRAQATMSEERERRTASLYALSRDMARSRGKPEIAQAAAREIGRVFGVEVAVFAIDPDGLRNLVPSTSRFEEVGAESGVARWAIDHSEPAGRGTDTLPSSVGYYLPLVAGHGAVGVLALRPTDDWPLAPVQQNLLETFANGLGLALERAALAKESHEARLAAESEKMRNALLSAISHDLRTPLTTIAGSASELARRGGDGAELAQGIYRESMRLNLQVQNLLDITRLRSNEVTPKLEWHALEEVVGIALDRTREALAGRVVTTHLDADLPWLRLDAALVERLLVNLLENAAHHTPAGVPIEVIGRRLSQTIWLSVADRGPGVPPGQEAAIFERFARGGSATTGLGLGLAICRAIARLHDARIWGRNRNGGGAEFILEFPMPADQPEMPRE